MRVIRKTEKYKKRNSDTCTVYEYHLGDEDIDGALAELTGRHPAEGFEGNKKSKELCYVMKGKLVFKDRSINLVEGDMVLIEPMEKYYWDGKMTIFMSCNPKWSADQHIFEM